MPNLYQNPSLNAPLGPDGLPVVVDAKFVQEDYEVRQLPCSLSRRRHATAARHPGKTFSPSGRTVRFSRPWRLRAICTVHGVCNACLEQAHNSLRGRRLMQTSGDAAAALSATCAP